MAETDPRPDGGEQEQPRTFTQEEVNALMGKVRREVEGKYPDYAALKEKAGRYDEAQAAAKSDLEKAAERADAAERELASLKARQARADLAAKVAAATGVPAALIQGDDEEAMEASARALSDWAASRAVAPADRGGAPGARPLTAAQVLAIGDARERRRAIKENIGLFE